MLKLKHESPLLYTNRAPGAMLVHTKAPATERGGKALLVAFSTPGAMLAHTKAHATERGAAPRVLRPGERSSAPTLSLALTLTLPLPTNQ